MARVTARSPYNVRCSYSAKHSANEPNVKFFVIILNLLFPFNQGGLTSVSFGPFFLIFSKYSLIFFAFLFMTNGCMHILLSSLY